MRCIIADDEYLVRFSILDMLKEIGEEQDIEFSAIEQAQDGEELLRLIGQMKPHLAFVDIRMPRMNGLDAIEKGKEMSPETDWIILTGYAEFEYAKKAVTLGAADYLLKPASKDEILACIEKVSLKRQKNRLIRRERLEHRLTGILYDTLSEESEENTSCYLGELFMAPFPVAESIGFEEFTEFRNRLRDLSDSQVYRDCTLGLSNMDDGSLLLMYQAGSEEELKKGIEWYHQGYADEAAKSIGYRMSRPVGSLSSCIDHLVSFSRNPVGLLGYPLHGMITEEQSEEFLRGFSGDRRMLELLIGFLETIDSRPEEFLSWIKEERDALGPLLEKTCLPAQLSQLTGKEFPASPEVFIRGLEDYVWSKKGEEAPKVNNRIVNRALYLIGDQYKDEIGLSQIADQLSVTPNYLSAEFHKELGKTFTQYITQLRLDKAKELLALQMYTIREIASMIGYSSSKHFSRVFKQQVGMSPSEYADS